MNVLKVREKSVCVGHVSRYPESRFVSVLNEHLTHVIRTGYGDPQLDFGIEAILWELCTNES